MTPERYEALAGLAGSWLEERRCAPLDLDEDSGREERAVYVVVNHDGDACYCGRTRPTRSLRRGAAATRLRQHTAGAGSKREEWRAYWVLPLRPSTPDPIVDALERTVAARLGLPLQNRRWRR
ncbi:hypothetical protein SA2016_0937 [Sinomonas atrocyanea]|uniref:GIY-YIG domain-containing protein n=1 Tax=Sinomonas atrocyanea TaxID=37927 RepID=A0A126ZWZ8_9MICC|nr:hypothetical protein [Sinomonas atrocyanea]AMM31623.1 hypothetical protein SA2016_0937 [Sinomonas atrocyanea]GEB64231.1 hypothetical protein SAT01_16790 [Sinomonas atrocyanea]GGG57435.1 hypothetical protein GCM10007172_05400 [Sinomonas atrocyanea]